MAVESTPLLLRLSTLSANPWVRAIPPLLIAGAAIFALRLLSRHVQWIDVRADLAASTLTTLGLATAAMVGSFAALSLYDVLAVKSLAKGRVPLQIAALAGPAAMRSPICWARRG